MSRGSRADAHMDDPARWEALSQAEAQVLAFQRSCRRPPLHYYYTPITVPYSLPATEPRAAPTEGRGAQTKYFLYGAPKNHDHFGLSIFCMDKH
jgi:hypothetical protein